MNRMLTGVLALCASGFAGPGAYADDDALTGVVRERHELMESMGEAVQSISAMVRGKADYDAERMRELAGWLSAAGGDRLTSLFPEGSHDPAGEALPAIWEDFERFSALADDLTKAANKLAEAADRPPAPAGATPPDPATGAGGEAPAMDAMTALVMSCKGCHDAFRKEDG